MELFEDFTGVLRRSGARDVDGQYFGTWDGYPFSAQIENQKEPGIVSFSFRLAGSLEGGLFRSLRKSLPKGLDMTAVSGSTYRLVCNGRALRKCDESLASLLNQITRQLRSAGVLPSDICPLCGQAGCDAYAYVGGYTAVHRACAEASADAITTTAQVKLSSGSYFTGFLGALVGGAVACIPTIIAYFAGWLVGYFYALIPLGAYFGYKLFRGRMNQGAFIFTCIASILHLLTIEQIIFYVMIVQYYEIWPSIFATMAMYFDIMTPAEMLSDMAMSALFMALGLWISWGRIRQNAHTDLGHAVSIRATLTDKDLHSTLPQEF